ncbi:MAG: outer membrane protein assembly factor BamE [Paracoccaceae bacterium]
MTSRFILLISLLLASGVVVACAPTQEVHGFVPSRAEIEGLTPGVDTVSSVEENLGRPSSTGLIDERGWYYVSTRIENFAFYPPKVTDRTVVAVLFDGKGTVASVNTYGIEDGRIINLNPRITQTSGRTLGILEQLFGNLGRFNASEIIDGSGG